MSSGGRREPRSRRLLRPRGATLLALLAAGPAVPLAAQQDLESSRRRLEEVRREREQLERERERLQGQVHDLGEELDNLERQRQSTNRIVNELERQIGSLNTTMDRVSADLALAQDNLAEKRAVLARRLAEIYKRGQLYPFQVLVAAESFGDLLSRYKYLYLQSRQDKALVRDVERLKDQVERRRREIAQVKSQLDLSRAEREDELRRYNQLVEERATRLREARRSARSAEQRLSVLERDEARLNELLAELEARRRRGGRTPGAPTAPGTLTTSDIGKLDWPVEGRIVYAFGRQTLPNGASIRRNGIGIGAPAGTPVKAVEAGTVELVQALNTYGLTVILTHGNGYRSLYMHLAEAAVKAGDEVGRGQVIGTVGGENTDEGPHLYFEIRGEGGIALDPADWLRKRR
ncbi:MAG TPA: peptidoglycan DD-metalloendopeptidase family protein [Gemmatimonadales bacterium]|nr:peptidoglycan DD-metalloendopeptidase family protein [Gemmatimonadales bacterium]